MGGEQLHACTTNTLLIPLESQHPEETGRSPASCRAVTGTHCVPGASQQGRSLVTTHLTTHPSTHLPTHPSIHLPLCPPSSSLSTTIHPSIHPPKHTDTHTHTHTCALGWICHFKFLKCQASALGIREITLILSLKYSREMPQQKITRSGQRCLPNLISPVPSTPASRAQA